LLYVQNVVTQIQNLVLRMARYYLDPEIRITGIVEDSHVGVWLVPHGEDISGPNSKLLFLEMVKVTKS